MEGIFLDCPQFWQWSCDIIYGTAHFHDVTDDKIGEKSMTTLKTLFHVFSAEELVEARVGLTSFEPVENRYYNSCWTTSKCIYSW